MKVAILGAYGFLGTHLSKYYSNRGDKVIKLGKGYDITQAKDCDYLVHCAFIGGREANTSKEIYKQNINITKELINKLKINSINIPIKFISSIQENNSESLYGKAKKISNDILSDYCDEKNIKLESYKLPNLFGTGGKPYYNCFVYTFAYNIANNIKSEYNQNPISLCHVSDAIKVIDNKEKDYKLHHSTVDKVYNILENLNKLDYHPKNLFEKQLYKILEFYLDPIQVLILGHKGMLGHMVAKILSKESNIKIITINERFPEWDKHLFDNIDFVINCIGAIPQRSNDFRVNWEVPIWLEKNTNCKIIHPSTDCEIDNDAYGLSKRKASDYIKTKGTKTKMIQTSIVGPELNSKASLLEWFLSQEGEVFGYTGALWNGNTTLEWSKWCIEIINNWDNYNTLTTLYSNVVSKFELLNIFKDLYSKDNIIIKPKNLGKDKTLKGDIKTKDIQEQIWELKNLK